METENLEAAPEAVENDNTEYQYEGQDGISIMQEAEIVLITTSLGGIKSSFFSSLRAQNLLNCKKFLYVVVDSNRDTSTAKNLKDEELFNKWKEDELLKSNENGVLLPQVLIDGVSIGNDIALQNLEDEGNLDFIVSRLKCPNCLQEKSNTDVQCPHCKYDYVSLISEELIQENAVVRMLQGELYNEEETAE
ncbi:conserved Plasmodium protein, unknown function [Plasmodium vivax]|uniref:Uncharacterized protein n=6 Tax=Plasmodium vivax TaxID=5855 RepID=A5K5G2_PLAVS|nr:hypothetical protein PVX_088907 [Plasmodium vivax]KMZ81992.1 hypothetical protein PVIIG_03800 [Plasmodium vivax India VII]KMZ88015.1 hypothetical protein PVBG_02476 [Plasmodium vivax Brazil I]KMZ94394.1 hypothetical protein PVMG_01752 [Plasmodium vivax Mauritania I]KNA01238.1 hypothetical protein PVNG_04936 [Plasmodium vivax North Korean]EDL45147.1 hypothetical protein PVX_088907 [Plasmodium vivax]|eukprot:XP_001614874.1 hypothetical protein [Plasmodium vivax Sal-1]